MFSSAYVQDVRLTDDKLIFINNEKRAEDEVLFNNGTGKIEKKANNIVSILFSSSTKQSLQGRKIRDFHNFSSPLFCYANFFYPTCFLLQLFPVHLAIRDCHCM